jgi:signal recognition particle subunit SRP54
MFDSLTKGFRSARQRLAGVAELTEENIDAALRDVRLSLLEADVELGVVKRFLATVKTDALGTEIKTAAVVAGRKIKTTPSDHFIKICQDKLVEMMSFEGEVISFAKAPTVTGIMMVGLQGAGKTTSAAKLARLLEKDFGRKVLLVAADVQRPGAIEQLQVLGQRIDMPVFAIPGGLPVAICEEGLAHAEDQARHGDLRHRRPPRHRRAAHGRARGDQRAGPARQRYCSPSTP